MLSVPKKVSERLISESKNYQKVLSTAKDRDVGESDTVTIIKDMLADVFGYDKYEDITSEQQIKGTYCDLAIILNGKIQYLIEVKAIGVDLNEKHLRQAVNYGVHEGIEWVILTNGENWKIYKLKFTKPVEHELVANFNFLEVNPRNENDKNMLYVLCKGGTKKGAIDAFHEHSQSLNRYSVAAIIQTDPVVTTIRRELRKAFPGLKVDEKDLLSTIKGEVLKREATSGENADKANERLKKSLKKAVKKTRSKRTRSEGAIQTKAAEGSDFE